MRYIIPYKSLLTVPELSKIFRVSHKRIRYYMRKFEVPDVFWIKVSHRRMEPIVPLSGVVSIAICKLLHLEHAPKRSLFKVLINEYRDELSNILILKDNELIPLPDIADDVIKKVYIVPYKRVFSTKDLSNIFGVSERTVRHWIKRYDVPSVYSKHQYLIPFYSVISFVVCRVLNLGHAPNHGELLKLLKRAGDLVSNCIFILFDNKLYPLSIDFVNDSSSIEDSFYCEVLSPLGLAVL